jgi:hypothetical protein
MLRSANARANTVTAVIEIDQGSSSEEENIDKVELKVEDTNTTASELGHARGGLQSRCFPCSGQCQRLHVLTQSQLPLRWDRRVRRATKKTMAKTTTMGPVMILTCLRQIRPRVKLACG